MKSNKTLISLIAKYPRPVPTPGTGKTFLSRCIAYTATQAGIKTLFTTAIDMINQLVAAKTDHTLLKKLQHYKSQDLLICDEIGYLPLGRIYIQKMLVHACQL